jgi:dihydroxyacetone kinase-like protein
MMSPASALTPAILCDWLARAATVFSAQRAYLTQLDADIGDGDHGENLARGFGAVAEKLDQWRAGDPASISKNVAMALIGKVGGASGPLYGSFFLDASKASAGLTELPLADWTRVFEAGVRGVQGRGKAAIGDKTMLDALMPALEALRAAPDGELAPVLRRAADAAGSGAQSTISMFARKGRASYLGERSAGHLDPGSVSSHLLLSALAEAAEAAVVGAA